ncbi:hypothetical protein [Paucimonas lemoignei]|uniref:hypothetical protein n=1 Tax=Paucimonas lemoignei TaxID=29443 RepID=UPI00104588F2|nr:hypothetical protein [Paucimonas lemoignei]
MGYSECTVIVMQTSEIVRVMGTDGKFLPDRGRAGWLDSGHVFAARLRQLCLKYARLGSNLLIFEPALFFAGVFPWCYELTNAEENPDIAADLARLPG